LRKFNPKTDIFQRKYKPKIDIFYRKYNPKISLIYIKCRAKTREKSKKPHPNDDWKAGSIPHRLQRLRLYPFARG
jgi:hypothetical protein